MGGGSVGMHRLRGWLARSRLLPVAYGSIYNTYTLLCLVCASPSPPPAHLHPPSPTRPDPLLPPQVLRTGMKHRKVGSHQLNMESSRSHSIMTIYCDASPTGEEVGDGVGCC